LSSLATPHIYTLSLHDALPIYGAVGRYQYHINHGTVAHYFFSFGKTDRRKQQRGIIGNSQAIVTTRIGGCTHAGALYGYGSTFHRVALNIGDTTGNGYFANIDLIG